ncbi:hypothetical protein ACWATR_25355 [Nostoc sp. UIC 10890]
MISINRIWSQVISYRSGAFLAVKFRQKYKSKGLFKPITIITALLYKWAHFLLGLFNGNLYSSQSQPIPFID